MKRLTCLGDSWMAGWLDADKRDHGGWPALLNKASFSVVNLAVSGSTAEQWASDFNGNLTRAAASIPTDVFCVSLMGNDAFAAMLPESDGGKRVTLQEIRDAQDALRKVVKRLTDTGKRVTLWLYGNPYPGNWLYEAGVSSLNAAARTAVVGMLEERDIIETRFVLRAQGMMSGIGIHPTPKGYAEIARMAESVL